MHFSNLYPIDRIAGFFLFMNPSHGVLMCLLSELRTRRSQGTSMPGAKFVFFGLCQGQITLPHKQTMSQPVLIAPSQSPPNPNNV